MRKDGTPLKSRYLGGHVEKTTMPNGAFVNKIMADSYTKRKEAKRTKIGKRITVLQNFSLENSVFIEGETSVIVWDTGSNMGIGKRKYQVLRELTNKPVRAVIYSHSHYTNGTRAFIPKGEEGESIEVIAHPDVHKNNMNSGIELAPAFYRNIAQHFGLYLPKTGPDSPPISFEGSKDEDKSSGYVKPTYEVRHGEEIIIDGIKMQFFYSPSDTNDSLTLWLPDDDAVITNSILSSFPNMYTLRGQPYRDPTMWIKGIDRIREINPNYLIPEHGEVMTNREDSYELATVYRDALAFIYSQTIRGINNGLKPDEIADAIQLPNYLALHPRLGETYLEVKHHIKGVYNGLIGWFSLDAADINPCSSNVRSKKLIDGFGGIQEVIASAKQSLEQKEFAWVAELMTYVLNVEPDNPEAKSLKAGALREMAYVTPALSSRNFYLTQALALEGKIDVNETPSGFSIVDETRMEDLPIEPLIKVLPFRINPKKAAVMEKKIMINLNDKKDSYSVHIRKGVAEVLPEATENADFSITLSSSNWLKYIFGKTTIASLANERVIEVKGGTTKELIEIFDVFEIY